MRELPNSAWSTPPHFANADEQANLNDIIVTALNGRATFSAGVEFYEVCFRMDRTGSLPMRLPLPPPPASNGVPDPYPCASPFPPPGFEWRTGSLPMRLPPPPPPRPSPSLPRLTPLPPAHPYQARFKKDRGDPHAAQLMRDGGWMNRMSTGDVLPAKRKTMQLHPDRQYSPLVHLCKPGLWVSVSQVC